MTQAFVGSAKATIIVMRRTSQNRAKARLDAETARRLQSPFFAEAKPTYGFPLGNRGERATSCWRLTSYLQNM